jgi:hypothetical protein
VLNLLFQDLLSCQFIIVFNDFRVIGFAVVGEPWDVQGGCAVVLSHYRVVLHGPCIELNDGVRSWFTTEMS